MFDIKIGMKLLSFSLPRHFRMIKTMLDWLILCSNCQKIEREGEGTYTSCVPTFLNKKIRVTEKINKFEHHQAQTGAWSPSTLCSMKTTKALNWIDRDDDKEIKVYVLTKKKTFLIRLWVGKTKVYGFRNWRQVFFMSLHFQQKILYCQGHGKAFRIVKCR